MPSKKADSILKFLTIAGYADPLNLCILTAKKAITASGVDKEPRRLINILSKQGYIIPINGRYDFNSKLNYSNKRFYQPTKEAYDFFGLPYKHITYKSALYQEHNHMLINVLAALYKGFNGDLQVEYPKYKANEPDALIHIGYKGRSYSFLVEMETGSWHIGAFQERLKKMSKLDYVQEKLPRNTKFLIIKANNTFNPYWLPFPFDQTQDMSNMSFFRFVKQCKEYADERFLFFPYHHLSKIWQCPNKGIMFDSKSNPRQFINNQTI